METFRALHFDGKVFIKPTHSGSSVDNGIFDCVEAGKQLTQKILPTDSLLVQEYIQ